MSAVLRNEEGGALPNVQFLNVWISYTQTKDILDKVRNRELKQYGINLEYRGVLNAVKRQGKNATPGEIAKMRVRRPHTISQVIRNMEKEGLITRHKDLKRKNMVRIAITEKGESAVNNSAASDSFTNIFESALTSNETDQFSTYVDQLRDKAEYRFAVDFHTKPIYERYRTHVIGYDFWRVLKRTTRIITGISDALEDTRRKGIVTGIQELDELNLVRIALTQECFSPDVLIRLSECIEILRSQSSKSLDRDVITSKDNPASESIVSKKVGYALWRSLSRTHDLIARIRDRELAQYGFSSQLALVLYAINSLGSKATASNIARWRMRSTGTITRLLKRMEEQGLIERKERPTKRRNNRVWLMEKGTQYMYQAMQAESIVQLFSSLSRVELEQFHDYLIAIRNRAMQELDEKERDAIQNIVLRADHG